MGKHTDIEWAQASWNPWMGCAKVSAGCKHCYMYRDQKRFGHDPTVLRKSKTTFRDPLKWKEPRVVFVCSWSDFFWEEVPAEWRREAWEVMDLMPEHTYLLLTKRPQNIRSMLPPGWPDYWKHVWLGVSAENQAMADLRIPKLLEIPAQVHFVSAEPLLGPINLRWALSNNPLEIGEGFLTRGHFSPGLETLQPISWVITGGESGPTPRSMDLEWATNIRDQCVEAGVKFFHKQHGGTRKVDGTWGGNKLDGKIYREVPSVWR